MICAALLCDNSIDGLLEAWEERGRRGRQPIYCRQPECQRWRNASAQRKHAARSTAGAARPRRDVDALPAEVDFIDADAWRSGLAEERRLEAIPEKPLPMWEPIQGGRVECMDCGRELWSTLHAVAAGGGRCRCQSCAAAA